MAMVYATVTGKITPPGHAEGLTGGIITATPMVEGEVLSFPAENQTTIGPAVGDIAADGTISQDGTPGLKIPTDVPTGTLWRLFYVPHRSRGLKTYLGDYEIAASTDLADLVPVQVAEISETVANDIAAAAALGATNDTATASFVANPASATAAALSATIATEVGRGVNAKTYATGDGVTDDTAALQAAIDAAGAGGTVFLPADAGTYLISGTLTISNPEVTILSGTCRSEFSPVIKISGPGPVFSCESYSTQFRGVNFRAANTTPDSVTPDSVGIVFARADLSADVDSRVEDCGFLYFDTAIDCSGRNLDVDNNLFSMCNRGVVGRQVGVTETRGYRVRGNRFHGTGGGFGTRNLDASGVSNQWCIDLDPAAFSNEVHNNHADQCPGGFYRGPLDRTSITDNMILKTDQVGILATTPEVTWSGAKVSGNYYIGHWYGGTPTFGSGYWVTTPDHFLSAPAGTVSALSIVDNTIIDTRKDGINIASAAGLLIDANLLDGIGIYYVSEGYLYDGISVAAGTDVLVGPANVIVNNRTTGGAAMKYRYAINTGTATGKVRVGIAADYDTGLYNGVAANRDGEARPTDGAVDFTTTTLGGNVSIKTIGPSTAEARTTWAETLTRIRNQTTATAAADYEIWTMRAGTLTRVAAFQDDGSLLVGGPSPVESAGWINSVATNSNVVKLVPRAATGMQNNAFFVDSADNLLKFKDNTGTVKTVTLA